MKRRTHPAPTLREQIPARDEEALRFFEARGYTVTIRFTSEGWRYDLV